MVLGVATLHVLGPGGYLSGSAHRLYSGYASDVLIPFAMYFVLCLSERNLRFVTGWKAKAALVFGAASVAEILQGFGIPTLWRTFDPLDFVMYGAGALAAVMLDRIVLAAVCGATASARPVPQGKVERRRQRKSGCRRLKNRQPLFRSSPFGLRIPQNESQTVQVFVDRDDQRIELIAFRGDGEDVDLANLKIGEQKIAERIRPRDARRPVLIGH